MFLKKLTFLNICCDDNNIIQENKALTSIVLPFPGGPNNNNPLAGALKPVNNWK